MSFKLTYSIITFGCQMNYSDSERIASVLEEIGYTHILDEKLADLIILNTCSIRQKGEDRVHGILKNLHSYKRSNPRLLIGVTGCMVRKTGTRNSPSARKDFLLKNLKSIDFVFRINDLRRLPYLITEAEPELELPEMTYIYKRSSTYNISGDADMDYLNIKPVYNSKFQAFVPIQIGCDKFCTYCIVPYSRGREKSRPIEDILRECDDLVKNGCLEINLVGQTVNSYGLSAFDIESGYFDWYHKANENAKKQMDEPFVKLLKELDKLGAKGLSRIRYESSHPKNFNKTLADLHANLKTLCPHLHLALQSGDDLILAKMNRKYTYPQFCSKIADFRRAVPGAAVTTDLIVGFCGETEEQFENTVRALEELQFDQVFLARYSQRPETFAAKNFKDDISREVKAKRWHKLNGILRNISFKKNRQYVGRDLEILVEHYNSENGMAEGRSRENKLVQFKGNPDMIGTLQIVKIDEGLEWLLRGSIKI